MQESKSKSLLQECRQIMTKRMRSSLTAMLNEVDDHLHQVAETRNDPDTESNCYEAIREIRMKRVEIKTRFERRFINLFDGELQFLTRNGEITEETRLELSSSGAHVIVTQSMERSLNSVKRDCGEALLELDRKLTCLLNTSAKLNPLQPEIVYEAFREACWDIKSGENIRSIMFRAFEKRINEDLKKVYADINSLLEENKKEACADELIDKSDGNAMNNENHALMRYKITERIENRLEGQKVPQFVRSFLLKHWRNFLEDVFNKYTENSIAWNAARQTMDDLIWLTSEDAGYYDRQRKVQLLPSLLFRLLNGMKVISMSDEDINLFLKQLKHYQINSLDSMDVELIDSITEDALENVEKNYSKLRH